MITVMILAGESSGELYGSLLAKALRKQWPDVRVIGSGGSRMSEAGVEIISPISDAFGLIEAVSALGKIRTALRDIKRALKQFRPEVLIPIDYPDFNLKVAAMAKPLGVKILYYVSPQVWAWRKGRVEKIARLVDRMTVILPFEEKIYRDAGVECEFVGHPILEEIEAILKTDVRYWMSDIRSYNEHHTGQQDGDFPESAPISELRTHYKASIGLDPNRPLLSMLPGSRPSELNRHFPLIIETIRQLKNDLRMPQSTDYQICVPLAPNTDETKYRNHLQYLQGEGVFIRKGESVRVLAASDLAVVASGTATLQTALLEVPMVVIYKLSPITYQLGKRIVKVKHISLVNILSGKMVVKELLQETANPPEIIRELKRLIFDREYRENMITELRMVKTQFSGKRPSERVAEIVMEMAGRRPQ